MDSNISEQLAALLAKSNGNESNSSGSSGKWDDKPTAAAEATTLLVPLKIELPDKFCSAFGLQKGATVRLYKSVKVVDVNRDSILDALAELAADDNFKLDAWSSAKKWSGGGKWGEK